MLSARCWSALKNVTSSKCFNMTDDRFQASALGDQDLCTGKASESWTACRRRRMTELPSRFRARRNQATHADATKVADRRTRLDRIADMAATASELTVPSRLLATSSGSRTTDWQTDERLRRCATVSTMPPQPQVGGHPRDSAEKRQTSNESVAAESPTATRVPPTPCTPQSVSSRERSWGRRGLTD